MRRERKKLWATMKCVVNSMELPLKGNDVSRVKNRGSL